MNVPYHYSPGIVPETSVSGVFEPVTRYAGYGNARERECIADFEGRGPQGWSPHLAGYFHKSFIS